MKKLNLLIAVAIALSAATMLYLAKATAAPPPDVCNAGSTANSCLVTISVENGKVVVDPSSQSLKKSEGQTVEWKCLKPDPCYWTVDFKGKRGPFTDSTFFNAHANSGKARTDVPADENRAYPYQVIVNGQYRIDPQIIIR